MVTSFASLVVGNCSPFDNRYVTYCVDNNRACPETLDCLDSWLAWSYTELMNEKWVEHGPWSEALPSRSGKGGKLIAGGYRGILCVMRGDEKFVQKAFHMRVSWVSEQVCWMCCASRVRDSLNLYTYFGPGATHRLSLISLSDFISDISKGCAWIRVPGFQPEMLFYDFLHVFDLTVVPDAAATAFWLDRHFVFCMGENGRPLQQHPWFAMFSALAPGA